MKHPIEARKSPRRKQFKFGIVSVTGQSSTIPCRVRDLSDAGARLEFEDAHVPDAFGLMIELDGLDVGCEVVWRRGSVAGVRFTSPPRFEEPQRVRRLQPIGASEKPSLRRKPLK